MTQDRYDPNYIYIYVWMYVASLKKNSWDFLTGNSNYNAIWHHCVHMIKRHITSITHHALGKKNIYNRKSSQQATNN